jgi:YYY domain-containing protein
VDLILQASYLLFWAGLLKGLQLALWPRLRPALGDYAYPAAYPVSLLLFALATWYCGLLRIPVALALLLFVALGAWGLRRGEYRARELRGLLAWDAIFLIGFLFALSVRFTDPVIGYFSEQYMNHAFLASVMREPVVPPLDPWFAGGHLTVYYYLGHWLMGCLGIVTGVPSEVAFNLIPATVYGTSFVMLYALGSLLLRRLRWVVLAVLLLVPPSVPWFLATGWNLYGAFQETNWIIPGARFEFPVFSLFLGNAHAFEMAAFNQFLLIFLLGFAWLRWGGLDARGRRGLALLIGLSIGSMPPLSSWDALVYGPVVAVFLILLWARERESVSRTAVVAVPAVAFLIYLPYYLLLQPAGVGGIGWGFPPTDPLVFLAIWGGFLAVVYAAVARDIRKSPVYLAVALPFLATGYVVLGVVAVPLVYLLRRNHSFPDLLCVAGLAVLAFCDLFYLREMLGGDYSRFNTIFKFYFDAWVLLGTGSLLLAGGWFAARRPVLPATLRRGAAVVAVAALLAAPFALNIDIGRGLLGIDYPEAGYNTLDGLAYLDASRPGEAAAIDYLRTLGGDHRIVEAENGDYGYYSRVSTFTGIPTILGQISHELTWRGNGAWYTARPADIRAIYERPNETIALMAKYNATLLYVGKPERERYDVRLPDQGLLLVYDEGGVQVYERPTGG